MSRKGGCIRMSNFPFYRHWQIRLSEIKETIDGEWTEKRIEEMIKGLDLRVVEKSEHVFDNGGLTIVRILSQSHLVVHTWPENQCVHLDLMTCSEEITRAKMIKVVDGWQEWAQLEILE